MSNYTPAEANAQLLRSLQVKVISPLVLSGLAFIGLVSSRPSVHYLGRLHFALFGLLSVAFSVFILEIYSLTAYTAEWWGQLHTESGYRYFAPLDLRALVDKYILGWRISFALHIISYLLFFWSACELIVYSAIWEDSGNFQAWGPFLFLLVPAATAVYIVATCSRSCSWFSACTRRFFCRN